MSANPGPGLISVVGPSGEVVSSIGPAAVGDTLVFQAGNAQFPDGWWAPGISSAPGIVQTVGYSLSFDNPDLIDGLTIYTPTIGDICLDIWVQVTTNWNGTTPKGDIGTFTGGNTGGFMAYTLGEPMKMNNGADNKPSQIFDCMLRGSNLGGLNALTTLTWPTSNQGDGLYAVAAAAVNFIATPVSSGTRCFPMRFGTADPIKFVVTQNGNAGGADPVASAGAAIIWLAIGSAPVVTAL